MRATLARHVHDRRLQSRLQFGSALGLAVGFVLAALIVSNVLGTGPARFSDFFYQSATPTNQVVIVAIDDASQTALGTFPWQRSTIAALINAIYAAQPRIIAVDVILPDTASDDATLAQALARAPIVIQPIDGMDATRLAPRPDSLPRFANALAPAAALQTKNTLLAHTLLEPDADGILRRVSGVIEIAERRYPAFGIAAILPPADRARAPQLETNQISFGTLDLPANAQGQILINPINPQLQRTLSAADVLRGTINPAELRDKIVLIGLTGSTAPEQFETPLSGSRPVSTVQVQADLIETILGAHTLVEQDRLTGIVMIFLLALLAGATLPHVRVLSAVALTIIYFLFYLSYAFQEFTVGVIVQPFYPTLALSLTWCGAMVYRYVSEERHRATITRLLRRYVPPEAVEQVSNDFSNGALVIGGTRRHVTVLHVDLRELDALTETLAPTALIQLLNQYIALIVAIIFEQGGTITKHTGDAILAGWNLLIDQPDHARHALKAAIEIKRAIAEFAKPLPSAMQITAGIGIATGDVVAGRIGAASRAEYAIIGEIVNMAERLGVKAERGIFMDDATLTQVGDEYATREVKSIQLRRKTDPRQVWQVLMPLDLPEPEATESEPDYEKQDAH